MAVKRPDFLFIYQRCDNPLEVCFVLNDTADKVVEKGEARHVDLIEAAEILKQANQSGLVHLCLGCGLCVTRCPAGAVSMKERQKA